MAERRRSSAIGENGELLIGDGLTGMAGMAGLINESFYGINKANPGDSLRRAALLGDERAFDAALSAGVTLEQGDGDFDKTLLSLAVEGGNLKLVRRLLEAGSAMLRARKPDESSHPVRVATRLNDPAMVALLLEFGAPEWSNGNFGPRGHAHLLHWAVIDGSPDVVRLLLDRGTDPNVRTEESGETALMLPCEEHVEEIVSMLVAAGADVKLVAADGMTALAQALIDRRSHMIPLLVAAGADPLDQIPKFQHSAFAHLIQKDENPEALLQLCKACPQLLGPGYRRSVLFWGLKNKHAEIVRMAVAAGADLKDTYGGKTVWQTLGKSKAAEPILRELRAAKTQRRIESAFDEPSEGPTPPKGSGGPTPL